MDLNFNDFRITKPINDLFEAEYEITLVDKYYPERDAKAYDDGYAPEYQFRLFPSSATMVELPEMLHEVLEESVASPIETIRSDLLEELDEELWELCEIMHEEMRKDFETAGDEDNEYTLQNFIEDYRDELGSYAQITPILDKLEKCRRVIDVLNNDIDSRITDLRQFGFDDEEKVANATVKQKYHFLDELSGLLMRTSNLLNDIPQMNDFELAGVEAYEQNETLPIELYQKMAQSCDDIAIDIYRKLDNLSRISTSKKRGLE